MPPKRNGMSRTAIEQLITQRVVDALLTYEANQSSKNGNGNGNDNGNGSHDSGDSSRRQLHTAHSNCAVECQVKYATFTLLGGALTWLNSHVRTIGHEATYEMTWKSLMKMMTEAYCPMSEIKKLEIEMVPEEFDKVEKYVGGLPDNIQGNVMSARPKMLQEAIELANSLMDQKVRAYAARC
ncbi:hypothetical protein Tco_0859990 [Tanacetum coccineum]|uniref:Retrotransposon gag domain-containing protein n=1 Tax=Tanacetum coccineum TaxID=301880 RepID=A0ABQ5BHG4_9ASTR